MNTHNLARIFNPASVALIGAGIKQNIAGRSVMKNLASGGFEGKIFHVNPQPETTDRTTAFAGLQQLPDEIDLVVVAAPMGDVSDILETCAGKKMGGAVIVSSTEGSQNHAIGDLSEQIQRLSKQTGFRVIGPDSVGIINTSVGLNASLMNQMPVNGKIAFLSQGADVCTSVLDTAMRENVGFSHFVSLGAMPDVCFADLIDYLGSVYLAESIVMALEQFEDIRNFMSAARAVSRVKPIIALKSGRTGNDAPLCEDEIWDAAFKRAGILRVDSYGALFDCAEFLAKQKRPKGSRLAVISNTKGIGVMAKDALAAHGLVPATLTRESIAKSGPDLSCKDVPGLPPDLILASTKKGYVAAVRACMDAPEVDGLLLLSSPVGTTDAVSLAREIAALVNVSPCPVLTAWMGGLDIDNARNVFNRAGIVTYETPERAVRAFVNLYQYGLNIDMLQQIPVRTDRRLEIDYDKAEQVVKTGMAHMGGRLPDDLARALVTAYGIPVGSARESDSADYELFIRATRHPLFGPVIQFGKGGLMTDVSKDMALALPPLNRQLAKSMIAQTKIAGVFDGYKTIKSIDRPVLEEMLIRVSRLITDFPVITRLSINPVKVANGTIKATHGRICLDKDTGSTDDPRAGQGHLVISPYPYWQETTITIKDNESVFIRPVRPSDAQQMIDLFEYLSPETVYLRFFSPIKEISRPMLIRMTQIDYDREIALIAFTGPKESRRIAGVTRIIFMPDSRKAEFAIVLADDWQGRGLGIKLLHHALVCTKKYDIEKVWGPVITTNTGMIKMGQKLGFDVRHDIDSGEYKMTISLDSVSEKAG